MGSRGSGDLEDLDGVTRDGFPRLASPMSESVAGGRGCTLSRREGLRVGISEGVEKNIDAVRQRGV